MLAIPATGGVSWVGLWIAIQKTSKNKKYTYIIGSIYVNVLL